MCMKMRTKKWCICCPNCGRYHGKSSVADSEYTCIKCGTRFVAIVSEGMVTTFEADSEEDSRLTSQVTIDKRGFGSNILPCANTAKSGSRCRQHILNSPL